MEILPPRPLTILLPAVPPLIPGPPPFNRRSPQLPLELCTAVAEDVRSEGVETPPASTIAKPGGSVTAPSPEPGRAGDVKETSVIRKAGTGGTSVQLTAVVAGRSADPPEGGEVAERPMTSPEAEASEETPPAALKARTRAAEEPPDSPQVEAGATRETTVSLEAWTEAEAWCRAKATGESTNPPGGDEATGKPMTNVEAEASIAPPPLTPAALRAGAGHIGEIPVSLRARSGGASVQRRDRASGESANPPVGDEAPGKPSITEEAGTSSAPAPLAGTGATKETPDSLKA